MRYPKQKDQMWSPYKTKKSKFLLPPNQNHCHQPKIGAKSAATAMKHSKLKAAKAPFVPG